MSLHVGTIGSADEALLKELFGRISSDPAAASFHPHPFTPEEAYRRATYTGRDIYAVMSFEGQAIGYGMLRGWDEGYAVPSLGIYVVTDYRGSGAARLLMDYLHLTAKLKGAQAVRLKVYPDNERAFRLYKSLGYQFQDHAEKGQLVGLRAL